MKRCPKCNTEYSDVTLEFCLEDGMRLVLNSASHTETPTIIRSNKLDSIAADETVAFPYSKPQDIPKTPDKNHKHAFPQTILTDENSIQRRIQILEISPLIIALAHNWWQWIYLNNQYYSSFSSYVLSANFLMWLLLLATGICLGLFGIKRWQTKEFSIASLVILSINLILFIVPKR